MKIAALINRALSMPPGDLFEAAAVVLHKRRQGQRRQGDVARSSFLPLAEGAPDRLLRTAPEFSLDDDYYMMLRDRCDRWCEGVFDLLGSGPVTVFHGGPRPGFAGAHYDYAADIRSVEQAVALLPPAVRKDALLRASVLPAGWRAIDWRRDHKSGYRWPEELWHGDVQYGTAQGADVKWPWEIGRLQQPLTAAACSLEAERRGDRERAQRYASWAAAMVADFVAQNPPRWGVQWKCTMDVAIRTLHLGLISDILLHSAAPPSRPWHSMLFTAVQEHVAHIADHLEWSPDVRGNHYLADICGLLAGAAWLPSTPHHDALMAFALQEISKEVPRQFMPDGANFEASVMYHRLSMEMVNWSVAISLGLGEQRKRAARRANPSLLSHYPKLRLPLPSAQLASTSVPLSGEVLSLLPRMALFAQAMTRPDGSAPQIGDNDSGVCCTVFPPLRRLQPAEAAAMPHLRDVADPRDLVVLRTDTLLPCIEQYSALRGAALQEAQTPRGKAEASIIRLVANTLTLPATTDTVRPAPSFAPATSVPLRPLQGRTMPIRFHDATSYLFEHFGVAVWKNEFFHLCFRAGSVGQSGRGGHAHNDQLSLVLWTADGGEVIPDPGTGVYTSSPALRNMFRSAALHFVPVPPSEEQCDMSMGLFRLGTSGEGRFLSVSHRGAKAYNTVGDTVIVREIYLADIAIEVRDFASKENIQLRQWSYPPVISPGYGVLVYTDGSAPHLRELPW